MNTAKLARFKSGYSDDSGDPCVEAAITEQVIHLPDFKKVTRSHFAVGWEAGPGS
jgi:hypothetical protein